MCKFAAFVWDANIHTYTLRRIRVYNINGFIQGANLFTQVHVHVGTHTVCLIPCYLMGTVYIYAQAVDQDKHGLLLTTCPDLSSRQEIWDMCMVHSVTN